MDEIVTATDRANRAFYARLEAIDAEFAEFSRRLRASATAPFARVEEVNPEWRFEREERFHEIDES